MPTVYCAPGCRSNYNRHPSDPIKSIFKFPFNEPERLKKWLNKFPRKKFTVTEKTVICERHFADYFLIRTKTVKDENGDVKVVQFYTNIFSRVTAFLNIFF